MSEHKKESLSALLDNEADDLELRRVLNSYESDPETRAIWERYSLAQALLHEEAVPVNSALSARVYEKIAREPALTTPRFSNWQQNLSKMAIAASVAIVFIVAVQSNLQQFEESKWVIPILANADSIAPSWGTELGLLFIDGSHTEVSAMNDYDNWSSKLHSQGALVIHDIYEKPEDGGQAPYLVYQKALKEGFQLFERVDTIVCLTKT